MADHLPTGDYLLRNIASRPELNGKVCSMSSSSFGAGQRTTYSARLQDTGELIKVYADKLQPLSEAPWEMLYDDNDLDSDEHPLGSDSSLLFYLRQGRGPLSEGFGVRIHGLTSDAGQQLNGQQGVAVRDNGNGRLGVRCQDGELRSVRIANLVLSPEPVALPPNCEARAGGSPFNVASRNAGILAGDTGQRGFFVHCPPSLSDQCYGYEGAGWPGVYTRRDLLGLAAASPEHVESCESWSAAWARWSADDNEGCDAFVFPLRTAVAADVTSDELFDCVRWFLHAARLGHEISTTDGVSLVGAHVEATQGPQSDGMPAAWGFVVLSACSADNYYMHDLLSNLVDEPTWRLTLRGQPLAFVHTEDCTVSERAPIGTPKQKRRVDDWVELKVCTNAPFAFASWELREHPSARSGMAMGMFADGPLVE